MPFNYYYKRLNPIQRVAYKAILSGFYALSNKIELPLKSMNEIGFAFDAVLLDNPIIFYISSYTVMSDSKRKNCLLQPVYKYPIKFIEENVDKIKSFLIAFDSAKNKSDIEKEYFIHDYCLDNLEYDHSFNVHSYSPLGIVLNKKAVCEGISKFVKLVGDYIGLDTLVVSGKASVPQLNALELPHAWNIVNIDYKPYHLDITFNMTLTDKIKRYDYFNLCDDDIKKDHAYESNVPVCVSCDNNYFYSNNLLANDYDGLSKIICQKLRLGERNIMVKLLSENNENEMMLVAQQSYLKIYNTNFSTSVSHNSVQSVVEINYT